ncbi:hypothetical protein M5689_013332 [Euphorbia peplus]|nr:hypothetical protein M5689_013332 [Euphorbia peplus]
MPHAMSSSIATLGFDASHHSIAAPSNIITKYNTRASTVAILNATSSLKSVGATVFIGGGKITHPDLFNNGLIIIHGIQGYVVSLLPNSCNVERLYSLTFPINKQNRVSDEIHPELILQHRDIMCLMICDVVIRLRNNGFNILSLEVKLLVGMKVILWWLPTPEEEIR